MPLPLTYPWEADTHFVPATGTLAPTMSDERDQAWPELHEATRRGWYVGRSSYHDEPVEGGFHERGR